MEVEPTEKERAFDRRNRVRIERVNTDEQKLVSKYLPGSVDEFLPNVIRSPDDSFIPPPWLMSAIEEVAAATVPTPKEPPARFELTEEGIQPAQF
jgi:hypothetical protein